jgi:lipid-A-disaccharide synthase-like uncharacterized protein
MDRFDEGEAIHSESWLEFFSKKLGTCKASQAFVLSYTLKWIASTKEKQSIFTCQLGSYPCSIRSPTPR